MAIYEYFEHLGNAGYIILIPAIAMLCFGLYGIKRRLPRREFIAFALIAFVPTLLGAWESYMKMQWVISTLSRSVYENTSNEQFITEMLKLCDALWLGLGVTAFLYILVVVWGLQKPVPAPAEASVTTTSK